MGVDVSPVLIYGTTWEDREELTSIIKNTMHYSEAVAAQQKYYLDFEEGDNFDAGICAEAIPKYFISNYSEYGGEGGYLGVKLSVGCPEEFSDSYRAAKEQWETEFPNIPGKVILDVHWW